MKADERLGTIDQVRAAIAPAALPIFDRLRAVAHDIDPESTETASPRERAVYLTLGRGKMTDGYAYIMGQKGHVNLGFFRGTDLPDPAGLLEGTGKRLRHVKLMSVEAVDDPNVRALIVAARDHMLDFKGRP